MNEFILHSLFKEIFEQFLQEIIVSLFLISAIMSISHLLSDLGQVV